MAPTIRERFDSLRVHENLPLAILVLLFLYIIITFILGGVGWFGFFFSLALVGLTAVGLIAMRLAPTVCRVQLYTYTGVTCIHSATVKKFHKFPEISKI